MKKLNLVIAIFALIFNANSQIEKGTKSINADLNYYQNSSQSSWVNYYNSTLTTSEQKTNSSQFNFSPGFNLFVKNNLSVGANLSLGYQDYKQVNTGYNSYTSKSRQYVYGLGLNAKKFFNITDKFYFTLNGSAAFNISTPDLLKAYQTQSLNIGISPGLTYFITPKFGLNASMGSLNYSTSKLTGGGSTTSNSTSFGLDFGPSTLNIGLSYYFIKKEK